MWWWVWGRLWGGVRYAQAAPGPGALNPLIPPLTPRHRGSPSPHPQRSPSGALLLLSPCASGVGWARVDGHRAALSAFVLPAWGRGRCHASITSRAGTRGPHRGAVPPSCPPPRLSVRAHALLHGDPASHHPSLRRRLLLPGWWFFGSICASGRGDGSPRAPRLTLGAISHCFGSGWLGLSYLLFHYYYYFHRISLHSVSFGFIVYSFIAFLLFHSTSRNPSPPPQPNTTPARPPPAARPRTRPALRCQQRSERGPASPPLFTSSFPPHPPPPKKKRNWEKKTNHECMVAALTCAPAPQPTWCRR